MATVSASSGGDGLEAEAASFRTALAAAFHATSAPSGQQDPLRPAKRKLTDEGPAAFPTLSPTEPTVTSMVASDPYAVPGGANISAPVTTGVSDPYLQPAYAVAAPSAAIPAPGADGLPRKKKKKKVRPQQPQAQQQNDLVVDPYL